MPLPPEAERNRRQFSCLLPRQCRKLPPSLLTQRSLSSNVFSGLVQLSSLAQNHGQPTDDRQRADGNHRVDRLTPNRYGKYGREQWR